MSITTTSTLPAPVQQSFNYKLLAVPVPYMIHNIPAMKSVMPRNGGTTKRFRRYNPLNLVDLKFSLIDLEVLMGQQGASLAAA